MDKTDSQLIDDLGGTGAVADLCELTPEAVSQWRKNGIPKGWRKFLQLTNPAAFGLPARRRRVQRPALTA